MIDTPQITQSPTRQVAMIHLTVGGLRRGSGVRVRFEHVAHGAQSTPGARRLVAGAAAYRAARRRRCDVMVPSRGIRESPQTPLPSPAGSDPSGGEWHEPPELAGCQAVERRHAREDHVGLIESEGGERFGNLEPDHGSVDLCVRDDTDVRSAFRLPYLVLDDLPMLTEEGSEHVRV